MFVCLDIFANQAIDKIRTKVLVLNIDLHEKNRLIELKVEEYLEIIKNIRLHILIGQYLGDSFHETFFEHLCSTRYILDGNTAETDTSMLPIVGGVKISGKKS